MEKRKLIEAFEDIMCDVPGICGFISNCSNDIVIDSLREIENNPITKVQFDQLLSLQEIKCISDDVFEYYWLTNPTNHFYKLPDATFAFSVSKTIKSISQLKWGFTRLFIDCLYLFGNIDKGFESIANMTHVELSVLFKDHVFPTQQIIDRGNTLKFFDIKEDDRYLISEMACKTFAQLRDKEGLISNLKNAYRAAVRLGIKNPTYRKLLDGTYIDSASDNQMQMFVMGDELDLTIAEEAEIDEKAIKLAERFERAHELALKNTKLYLSLVNDLDVYVATSMRTRDHFVSMSRFCRSIFKSDELREFDLRFFDPTMSAADSHEDKGLIECLMVKSARMLIYSSGDRDSFGKDVEAAMALCLGKPTIFFCPNDNNRGHFFRDVHPLSRLVDFSNGVAGGAIVCQNEAEVISIVKRLVTNTMSYSICKKEKGRNYYLLKENLTDSIVRVQTDDTLLNSVFWNNYTKERK